MQTLKRRSASRVTQKEGVLGLYLLSCQFYTWKPQIFHWKGEVPNPCIPWILVCYETYNMYIYTIHLYHLCIFIVCFSLTRRQNDICVSIFFAMNMFHSSETSVRCFVIFITNKTKHISRFAYSYSYIEHEKKFQQSFDHPMYNLRCIKQDKLKRHVTSE